MQYPDWVMEAKESRKLLPVDTGSGTQSSKCFTAGYSLKCQEEDCIVILCSLLPWRRIVYSFRKPKLCGVLYLPDYSLYEVETAVFYEAVGIPADFLFPTRESLKKEVEMQGHPSGEES